MKEIIENLGLNPIVNTCKNRNEEIFYFIKSSDDKLLFLTKINVLEEINSYTSKLPALKDEIVHLLVDDPESIKTPVGLGIDLPSFLWDIYVLGFHDFNNNDRFNSIEIEKIRRDNFIARKMVIEYTDFDNLKKEFFKEVYPEKIINEIIESFQMAFYRTEEIIDHIDKESIKGIIDKIEKNQNVLSFSILQSYLEEIEDFIKSEEVNMHIK